MPAGLRTLTEKFFTNRQKYAKKKKRLSVKGVIRMEEKRGSRRISLSARLLIKNMNDASAKAEEVEIDVQDVSKTGVGFICDRPLEIGAIYEANLKIWTQEVIHAFLKMVRIEQTEDEHYICGTIFIGLPEIDAKRIEVYDLLGRIQAEDSGQ